MNYVRGAFAYEVKNDIVCILHESGIIGYGKEFEYSQRSCTIATRLKDGNTISFMIIKETIFKTKKFA